MVFPLRLCFVLAAAAIFSSCSTYQADFAQAVAAAKVPADSPYGPWQGRWKSNFNGHEGPLWCIVSRNPEDPQRYDFRYRAGWGRLQFGDYLHTVAPENPGAKTIAIEDTMKLPGAFGTYSVKGKVSPDGFDATFRSDGGDHGTMTLRRPQ